CSEVVFKSSLSVKRKYCEMIVLVSNNTTWCKAGCRTYIGYFCCSDHVSAQVGCSINRYFGHRTSVFPQNEVSGCSCTCRVLSAECICLYVREAQVSRIR